MGKDPRLSREPQATDYMFATGLAAAAVLCRAIMESIAPASGGLVVILPAVVLAGVFCGTAPALVTAAAGGIAIAALFPGRSLLAWPPLNSTQLDALVFLPACAMVLWATHNLRRSAADAAAAEARLAEVFRQIPGAAAILEAPGGRLLLRSTQSESVLGHQQRQVERSDDLVAYGGLHPDGRQYAADDYPIVRALKTGEIVRGERLRYRRPDDGRVVDLEVHAGPVLGPQGRVLAAVGMAFDVTERVQAEGRLLDSEARHRAMAERLRAAIDAGALGVWELDLATQRMRLDAALAGMFGLPAEPTELSRADIRRFADRADLLRASKVLASAVAGGGTYADELRMRTAQGAARWFVIRGAVLADVQKVVGVVRDVTERRRREETLQAALHARDVLMYEADHRIKNSLQLVVALLRLQLARVGDPDVKHALGEAIARVDAVANAHLALQRSSDLRSIEIDRMVEDLCSRVGSLNPAIKVICDSRIGLQVDAEKAIPLGLIVSELLTNALRHAYPSGTPGEVTLTAAATGGTLDLSITDGGVGLPVGSVRPGLGSTVIATLARQIGVTIASHSRPGRGTTVNLQLKLPPPDG
jgi:PAS domain S-box-containing protein